LGTKIVFSAKLTREKTRDGYTRMRINIPARIARYLEPGEYTVILIKKE